MNKNLLKRARNQNRIDEFMKLFNYSFSTINFNNKSYDVTSEMIKEDRKFWLNIMQFESRMLRKAS